MSAQAQPSLGWRERAELVARVATLAGCHQQTAAAYLRRERVQPRVVRRVEAAIKELGFEFLTRGGR